MSGATPPLPSRDLLRSGMSSRSQRLTHTSGGNMGVTVQAGHASSDYNSTRSSNASASASASSGSSGYSLTSTQDGSVVLPSLPEYNPGRVYVYTSIV
ncbi:hypothetical protein KIPB_008058 [Kipferlia bialata]|uniref:Uncharacterized protein n=1 Tax=Kipferlia bialata TaxID=797122 RepID=A0A391NMV3_9EUKA|nr:hypothetical protein KIPB_008058 [Kipferlia bialata]|eukprot:g8058.t1